jgi:hypothetical protein
VGGYPGMPLPVAASSRADGRTLTLCFIDAPRRFADDRAEVLEAGAAVARLRKSPGDCPEALTVKNLSRDVSRIK